MHLGACFLSRNSNVFVRDFERRFDMCLVDGKEVFVDVLFQVGVVHVTTCFNVRLGSVGDNFGGNLYLLGGRLSGDEDVFRCNSGRRC